MKTLRFCLAQINTTVGDIKGNTQKIIAGIKEAEKKGNDIIVFPELATTGYPPEDLLLKKKFVDSNMEAVSRIAKNTGDIIAIAGFVRKEKNKIYNSAAVICNGKIAGVYDKINLPNYGVFDEKRYFTIGGSCRIFRTEGINFGVSICEDIWVQDKILMKMSGKIDFLINLNASPYHAGRWKERRDILKIRAKSYKTEIIYVNLIGGQDELVFDGHSLVMDRDGKIIVQGKQFYEDMVLLDRPVKNEKKGGTGIKEISYKIKEKPEKAVPVKFFPMGEAEEIYNALILGVKDYVQKNGFKKVLVALSGGVDSALVSCVAADALGAENLSVIFMPSRFSSKESFEDAKKLSDNLKIKLKEISIQEIFDVYLKILKPFFEGRTPDITEENLQARIRGNIIMAFSNKFRWLVLTTGNKSEMSTGYATLYGDMAGGFAVIKDVPKTLVYRLARWRNKNAGYDLIPENILTKAPTAELKENQKDQDTLPEYELLDRIIEDYIEKDKTYSELKGKYDEAILKKVISMIDTNEYKRRQSAPGVKITPKAFGRDRRVPITNKYKE